MTQLSPGCLYVYILGASQYNEGCMHAQIKRGEVFISETDTEVIPKLCNYVYKSTQEKLSFYEVRIDIPHIAPAIIGQVCSDTASKHILSGAHMNTQLF